MHLRGPSDNNRRTQSPRLGGEAEIPSIKKWGEPRLELHWYTPTEEMNLRFKHVYGFDYPVNRQELIDMVGKKVIQDIDEARRFVIGALGNTEFFKHFPNPMEAVYVLERHLATDRNLVCDLPQPRHAE
jgi:hypothetical protein